MISVPAFQARFVVQPLPASLLLLSESDEYRLRGTRYARVAALVDGRRTVSEIARLLKGELPATTVRDTVRRLAREGFLHEARMDPPGPEAAFWENLGLDACEAKARLGAAAVEVTALDEHGHRFLREALGKLGLHLARRGDLRVVIAGDYAAPALDEINRRALEQRRPWLLVKPCGRSQWVGPIFVPGRTGCWRCLLQRLKENRWIESLLWGSAAPPPMPAGWLETTGPVAVLLAATEAAKWVALGASTLEGRLWTLDNGSLEAATHGLMRRPQCPACGDPRRARRPVRIALRERSRVFRTGGGLRTRTPPATLADLQRLVSPITGIVSHLQPAAIAHPFFVFSARHTLPLAAPDEPCRSPGQPGSAVGKGTSETEARVSCLAEAVERYSAVFQGNERRRRACYAEFGDSAVHPRRLLLFSDRQYAGREQWNRRHAGSHWIPEPFRETEPVDWTPAWSLTHQRIRYLPTAYCYLLYRLPEQHRFCRADSNGCASGNVIEEAILQGLFELVERDAVALWWYNRARRPGIDLGGAAGLHRGRSLHALDLTTDLGIPVAAAVSHSRDGSDLLLGMGAHLDRQIALTRALSEIQQVLGRTPSRRRGQSIADHPYIMPCGDAEWNGRQESAGLLADLEFCIARLAARGLEVLVVDLSRPDLAFPAVRVVAPGLRHWWARLAPGRLYDVPVELGWIPKRLAESELNTVPFIQ